MRASIVSEILQNLRLTRDSAVRRAPEDVEDAAWGRGYLAALGYAVDYIEDVQNKHRPGQKVEHGEYGQRLVGAEITLATKDDNLVPCLAVVCFDSWQNIGGTAQVVAMYRVDQDGKRTEADWNEHTERRVVREFLAQTR